MSRPRRRLTIAVLLVAATLAVFGQVVGFDFVSYDDGLYVSDNPTVGAGLTAAGLRWAFGFHAGNWHPLTWLSLMLDAQLGGGGPAVFHATNLLLHLASVLLLFRFLAQATDRDWAAGCVALLFAIHPLHVESVAWVAERKDVLSGLFWMLALSAYASYAARPGAARYAGVLLAFGCGLAAKPMVVTLPVVLLLLDVWPLRRPPGRLRLLDKLPLAALAVASSAATLAAQRTALSGLEVYPLAARLENAVVSYAVYLLRTIWPGKLSFFYAHPGETLPFAAVAASAVLLAAITLAALAARRERPWLAVGWAWYVVTLLPVIGIVQVGIQARADRYTYLPLVGVLVMIVWSAQQLAAGRGKRARRALAAAAATAMIALAGAAHVQAGYWRDSRTLYERALEIDPANPVAHANLGLVLERAGDLEGAMRHSSEAMRLNPRYTEPLVTLAKALAASGRLDEAEATYRRALEARPDEAALHSNLGTVLAQRDRQEEAAQAFEEALRLDPRSVEAHNNLGVLRARQGRYDEAIEAFSTALKLSPFDEEARSNLELARSLRAAAP